MSCHRDPETCYVKSFNYGVRMIESIQNRDYEETVRLKEGDREAFNQIFDRYHNKLIAYTVTIVKSSAVAKDLVQETFIRLWLNRMNLDPSHSLGGFLHTIARNLALNHLKKAGYDQKLKERIWVEIQDEQESDRLEESIFGREISGLLERAIDQLPPQRKKIFILSREEGLSHKEIADILGISRNTVKNQIVSALKNLHTYLIRYRDTAFYWIVTLLIL